MNSFGLGLVLNFTDNATSGMRRVSQTFRELDGLSNQLVDSSNSAMYSIQTLLTAGTGLTIVGESLSEFGSSITDVFMGITQSVIETGGTMQGFRMQLQALYGDDLYEQKLQEIKDYARDSVFEIEGLMSAVTMMKAVGIEAMDEVTTSSGDTTQKLLDYASDIAAMFPNMRNAYGTGVNAAMGALKEYIAEGNALTLKRSAGLDITGILGEDKGSTFEERIQQVADLTEQLGIAGYTINLVGTPTQQLAKMQDILFNTMSDIADSGVYAKYTELLTKAATWVENLSKDTEKYNAIVSILGDTITSILNVFESLLDHVLNLADAFTDWAVEHPVLAKNILTVVAALGGLLVVFGQVLKLSGGAFNLLGVMKMLGFSASNGINFFNILSRAIGIVTTKILPFAALAGVLYYAWTENIFGIRDTVTKALSDLGTIFSLVSDAWSDNTLSEDNFQKAKQLGILPLIEGILQLKYYWDFLVEGFKTGFKAFFEGLADSLSQLGIIDIDVNKLVSSFGEFLDSLVEVGAEDKWRSIGETLGKFAGGIIAFTIALHSLKTVASIVKAVSTIFGAVGKALGFVWDIAKIVFNPIFKVSSKVIGFFKDLGAAISLLKEGFKLPEVLGAWFPKIAGVFGKVGGVATKVGGVFGKIGTFIASVITSIAGFFNIPVAAVVAIIAAVVALGVIIAKNWDKVKEILGKVGSWIYNYIIIPVRNFFASAINFVVGLVATAWEWVSGILSKVGTWIYNNLISPVLSFFSSLWDDIVSIWSRFSSWVSENIIDPVVMFFRRFWNKVTEIFTSLYNKIGDILRPIGEWINTNVIQPTVEFFQGLWTDITEIFNGIYDSITGVFQDAWDFVTGLWGGIADFFGGIWDDFTGWVGGITDKGESITGIESTIEGNTSSGSGRVVESIVPEADTGVKNFIGGLIQVNEKGGELIELPSGSTVVPHDQSIRDSLEKGISIGANTLAMYASKQPTTTKSTEVKNDYSVTFSAGSIVIQLANATEAELERAAEKLMRIIERKQKLKAMAVRA